MSKYFLMLCGLFAIGIPVYGFQPDFPKNTFDITGSGKTRSLLITNKDPNILAVEISIVPREIDSDGQEFLGDPSPDFDVYPPQVLINPGEDAYVTLVWKGEKALSSEQAYRVVSNEVPFQDGSKFQSGKIQLVIGRRFLHAAYVKPPKVKPDIRLSALTVSANATTTNLVVTLENRGKAHQIVSDFGVSITNYVDDGRVIPLDKPVLLKDPAFRKRVNLLVGGRREYVIPWPAGLPKKELRGVVTDVR